MEDIKKRKIEYHELTKKLWRVEENNIVSFSEVFDLLKFILKKSRKNRIHSLKNSKFCLLDSYSVGEYDDYVIVTGLMKSANKNFTPNLINANTGEERQNTKTRQEGDVEKTHFAIRINNNGDKDSYLILEKNGNGVTVNQLVDYLGTFNVQWVSSKGEKRYYSIKYVIIVRDDYEEILKSMNRATIAEVYFDKSLVGTDALDFSNKTMSAKRDVVLTIRAEKDLSLKEMGFDLLQGVQSKKSKISKIRIFGKDDDKHDIMIDTEFLGKKTEINADLNPSTGEVITSTMYTELKKLAENII